MTVGLPNWRWRFYFLGKLQFSTFQLCFPRASFNTIVCNRLHHSVQQAIHIQSFHRWWLSNYYVCLSFCSNYYCHCHHYHYITVTNISYFCDFEIFSILLFYYYYLGFLLFYSYYFLFILRMYLLFIHWRYTSISFRGLPLICAKDLSAAWRVLDSVYYWDKRMCRSRFYLRAVYGWSTVSLYLLRYHNCYYCH